MRGVLAYATREPTLCPVCRRRAIGKAYAAPYHGAPILWRCADDLCGAVLPKIYRMTMLQFDEFEIGSRREASEKVGAWLDGIGKTDLATLTPDEWSEMWDLFLREFGAIMQRKLLNYEAPF